MKKGNDRFVTHSINIMFRVTSRVCIVPFSKPAIAPQQKDFDKLHDIICSGEMSTMFSWIVRQRSVLSNREELNKAKEKLQCFKGRTRNNWAHLSLCVSQVIWIYFNTIIKQMLNFSYLLLED